MKEDEIGVIKFYPRAGGKCAVHIKLNSNELMSERVRFTVDEQKVKIERAGLDDEGKTYQFTAIKSGWHSTIILLEREMPAGKILFDPEESDKDCLIAYFEDLEERCADEG